MRAIVWLVLGFGGAQIATAETYHVSVSGELCSPKQCACPRNLPCRFSQELLARLRPGDIVLLAGGSYASVPLVGLHGTPEASIIIQGEAPVEAPVVFNGRSGARDVIEVRKSAFVELRGLTVRGARRAGVWINNSHNVSIQDCVIKENGVWGVFTSHSNDVTVSANRILGPATQHGIYLSNSGDRGLLEHNLISDFDGSGIQLNGDKRMAGAEAVIGDGIIDDVVIRGNYISNNGRSGGAAVNLDGARNTHIVANMMFGNHSASVAMFGIDGAIATRNTLISGNFIVGAVDSRALIIVGDGALDQFLSNNVLIGLNPESALISVVPEQGSAGPKGFFAWFTRRNVRLPATFAENAYSAAGAIAVLPELERFETLAAWTAVAPDRGATLIQEPASDLAGLSPADLYRRLGGLVEPQSPLLANPHIDVLRLEQDKTYP